MALEYLKPDYDRFLRFRKLEGWPLEGVKLVTFPYLGHQPRSLGLPGLSDPRDNHQLVVDLEAATSDESGITFDSSEGLKTTSIGQVDDFNLPIGTIGREERWWFVPDFLIEELPFDPSYKKLLRENTFICGPGALGVEGTDLDLLEEFHPYARHHFERVHEGIPFPMVLNIIQLTMKNNAYQAAKAVRLNLGDSFDLTPGSIGSDRPWGMSGGDRPWGMTEVVIDRVPTQERPITGDVKNPGKVVKLVTRISPGLGRKLSSRKLRPKA